MGAAVDARGKVIGRYIVYDEIAAGGMASVHLARLVGAVGFSRTVAVKRLHVHLARDEDFTAMFLDEARLAARIRHPNVVAVLDVVHEDGELFLVMDYVQGESLSRLVRAIRPGAVPPRIAVSIVAGALHGLHAAHEATTEHGEPLHIVHRDVSPQNVIVGTDGIARVLDFGVAKAAHRVQSTQDGSVKGKIAYMSPEQLLSEDVDRRADLYAAAVMLWEALTGERLFDGDNQGRVVRKILDEPVPLPSQRVPGLPHALDKVVMKGLEREPARRWQTARDFATALERAMPGASATEVGEWVDAIGGRALGERAARVKEIESRSDVFVAPEEKTRRADGDARDLFPTSPVGFAPLGRPHAPMSSPPTVAGGFAVMSHVPSTPGDVEHAPSGKIPVSSVRPATGGGAWTGASPSSPGSSPHVAAVPVASVTPAPGGLGDAIRQTPMGIARDATREAPHVHAGVEPPRGEAPRVEPASARRLVVPSPLAPLGVQTIAVTPLASLEEAAAAKRAGGRRMLIVGIVLALVGALAVAAAIAWTLVQRR